MFRDYKMLILKDLEVPHTVRSVGFWNASQIYKMILIY